MKRYEITKDIFIIGGPDITDDRDGCVYVIDLGELILIDSGARWGVYKIINNINILGFNGRAISTILLTHCHIDHIGGRRKSGRDSDLKSTSMSWMLRLLRIEIQY